MRRLSARRNGVGNRGGMGRSAALVVWLAAGCIPMVMSPTLANAQTIEAIPAYSGIVTRDGTSMQCRLGSASYPVKSLANGQMLRVIGQAGSWLQVEYTPGMSAFVKIDDATLIEGGKAAKLTRNSRLMAANADGGVNWWYLLDKDLPAGTTFSVTKTVKGSDGKDTGYLVPAPKGAYGFIRKDAVRQATQAEIDAAKGEGATPAPTPAPAAPAPTPTGGTPAKPEVGTKPATPAVNQADAARVIAEADQLFREGRYILALEKYRLATSTYRQYLTPDQQAHADAKIAEAQVEISPTRANSGPLTPTGTTPPASNPTNPATPTNPPATAPAGTTPPPAAPATTPASTPETASPNTHPTPTNPPAPPAAPARAKVDAEALAGLYHSAMTRPEGEVEIGAIIGEFEKALAQIEERPDTERLRRQLSNRLDALKLRADLLETLRQSDQRLAALRTKSDTMNDQLTKLEKERQFAVVGRLLASSVYDGRKLPLMYRVTSADATAPRTLAYVVPTEAILLADKLGNMVGVAGDKKYDEELKVNVITPTRVETVTVPVIEPTPPPAPPAPAAGAAPSVPTSEGLKTEAPIKPAPDKNK